MMTGSRNDIRGFTLVETLVAIAIFTLAIIGPFAAASRALDAAAIARDNLIASNLAQEGLEAVRAIRGSNYLANPTGYSPLAGLSACIAPAKCTVDASTITVAACSGTCHALYLTSSGLYTQSSTGATATKFTRSLTITQSPGGLAGVERATATVTWTASSGTKTVTETQDFYDWL